MRREEANKTGRAMDPDHSSTSDSAGIHLALGDSKVRVASCGCSYPVSASIRSTYGSDGAVWGILPESAMGIRIERHDVAVWKGCSLKSLAGL